MRHLSFKAARATEPASALLIATLAAMLLAGAATMTIIETRNARAASGEALRLAEADAKAQSALAQAIIRLDAGEALPTQGLLFTAEDGARVLRQDAAGLVDINTADPSQLAALMIARGVSAEHAQMLADRIADWRDSDDLKRVHGAEAAEYAAAGFPAPANRPFEVETEIAKVLGFDARLIACLAPYLTVYSGSGEVEGDAAPPELRAALSLSGGASAMPGAPLGRVIELEADAPISTQAFLRRSVWVRLGGDAAHPLAIHRAAQSFAASESSPPRCPSENDT